MAGVASAGRLLRLILSRKIYSTSPDPAAHTLSLFADVTAMSRNLQHMRGGKLSSGGGGKFGELLLVPRPRAARLLEKIGASLTEESAHFGFGLREKSFPCKNQSCRESRDKHDGPL